MCQSEENLETLVCSKEPIVSPAGCRSMGRHQNLLQMLHVRDKGWWSAAVRPRLLP